MATAQKGDFNRIGRRWNDHWFQISTEVTAADPPRAGNQCDRRHCQVDQQKCRPPKVGNEIVPQPFQPFRIAVYRRITTSILAGNPSLRERGEFRPVPSENKRVWGSCLGVRWKQVVIVARYREIHRATIPAQYPHHPHSHGRGRRMFSLEFTFSQYHLAAPVWREAPCGGAPGETEWRVL